MLNVSTIYFFLFYTSQITFDLFDYNKLFDTVIKVNVQNTSFLNACTYYKSDIILYVSYVQNALVNYNLAFMTNLENEIN